MALAPFIIENEFNIQTDGQTATLAVSRMSAVDMTVPLSSCHLPQESKNFEELSAQVQTLNFAFQRGQRLI